MRKRYNRGMSGVSDTIGTAVNVANDPYLPEVVCRINQLTAVERNEPVGACVSTPAGIAGGVGLRTIMPGLRAYVFAQQHKWVYPLLVATLIGLPYYLGYEHGKADQR